MGCVTSEPENSEETEKETAVEREILPLVVTSSSFTAGGPIPEMYCFNQNGHTGDNVSPQLSWTGAPEGTHSFAIIMDDPSANNWSHWVLYNLPAHITSLEEGFNSMVTHGIEGKLSSGAMGYEGPYPPSGNHNYSIQVYALDSMLDLSASSASRYMVRYTMEGHVLAQGELLGTHAAH